MNAAVLSRGLGAHGATVARYIDLLVDLLLVRRLPSLHANVKKQLVKSPKINIRDSGIVHSLLGIVSHHELMGHPVVGTSWEGFVIEQLLSVAPPYTLSSFYRTAKGAEIDLVLELPGMQKTWPIEVKLGTSPKLTKRFYQAIEDVQPDRCFIVHSGTDRYVIANNVEAIGLSELCYLLAQ